MAEAGSVVSSLWEVVASGPGTTRCSCASTGNGTVNVESLDARKQIGYFVHHDLIHRECGYHGHGQGVPLVFKVLFYKVIVI